jgi:N-acyl-D-amino-acid deacylase
MTGNADPNLAPLDNLLPKFLADNKIPGAAAAVTRHGKLVYSRGFGYADLDAKQSVQPDALFRIASLSKPITSAGILMLAEQGKLKLDDPVLKYISLKPATPPGGQVDKRWETITIRHCLHHTGGWDRGKPGGFDPIGVPSRISRALKIDGPPTPQDVVRYMMGQPLDFEPGEKMAYSNLGYLLLGRAIETVTGSKYEPWIQKQVLAPVKASGMALGRALPENRAIGEVHYYDAGRKTGVCLYPPRAGQQVPRPDGAENLEGYEAHGGWIASAIDLVRFAGAFDYGHKSPLLSEDSIKQMWARPEGAPGHESDGKPKAVYYGCGWNVRPVGDTGKANTWHAGLISGTSTLLVRRWDGFNWAILFNTNANPDGKTPANLIDGPMHGAVDAVEKWPERDLFHESR